MFNRKVNTRLSLLKLNRSIVLLMMRKNLQNLKFQNLRIFYPGDQFWLRNLWRGKKWIKGTIISKVGTVLYKGKCSNEM